MTCEVLVEIIETGNDIGAAAVSVRDPKLGKDRAVFD
jgi:hypothetical protein